MKIHTLDKDDLTILFIDGELDASSAIELDTYIEQVVEDGKQKLLIDCSQLNYISSAGLGVFMSHVQEFEERNIHMVLFGLSDKIFRIFQILGLDHLIKIVSSEEEAQSLVRNS